MQGLVGPAKDAVGELYFLILFQLIISSVAPDYHIVGGYLKQKSSNNYVIWCLMMATELAFIDMLALSNVDVTVDAASVA